jgi:hypothetical protein
MDETLILLVILLLVLLDSSGVFRAIADRIRGKNKEG